MADICRVLPGLGERLSARELRADAVTMASPSSASTVESTEYILFSSLCKRGDNPLSVQTRPLLVDSLRAVRRYIAAGFEAGSTTLQVFERQRSVFCQTQ